MIKNYLLTCLLFSCAFISYGQTYNQITTLGDLTDGNYLIVGDGTSNDGLMVNSTFGSVSIDYTAITNPGATITTGYTANNVFNITVSGGNITIYNSSVGYASWGRSGATANDADFYNGTVADTERWTPTVDGSGLWTLANVDTSTRILQWNNSAPRFVAYASNQVKLKIYKEDAPANTTVQFTSTTSTLTEDGLFIDVYASISNPSATVATTVDITLNASSTATNGTDYDDGAGIPAAISFPQTLTFPANSSVDEFFTIYISNDDLLVEGNETVVLDLVSPAGGDAAALGSNDQHVLTIIDNEVSAIADVVITEIMYDSAGFDDEWIEICNVSGSPQVLNDYTVNYNGSTLFTFPSSGVIMLDGTCITVSLGSNGDGIYNNDCPFTPDYGIGASTFNNNNLINTSATISLVASDGTTDIDVVTYDDGDGANNTGESLHVVDTSLDNSITNTNYWEVLNGGSPGINTLISPCTPPGPEINVEGDTGNYPDIADGDVTPSTFDGTDFGSSFIGSPLSNPFRIENFAGTTDLIITSVTVLSGDTGDFSITTLPASPIAALGTSSFDIEFNPTAIGTRTAVIQIISNDADENPYTFTVTGEGLCFATGITATPTSGPVDTIVTVTGTDLLTATATFNGLAATVYNISATLMTVIVPAGATTGNLEITDSNGCPGSTPFTVIDSEISGCEGSGGTIPTDLFISEITDATYGGLSYVELFNGTGAPVNIDNYSIEVIANGDPTAAAINIFDLENFTMPNGTTYVIAIGRQSPVTSTNACTSITGGSGELASSANAQFSSGGINKKTNEHDVIRLVNTGTTIDEFGVYEDSDWMDSTIITGDRGFNFRRSNTATVLPDPTFTLAELGNWTVIDWVGSGTASCSGNDYSHIGIFDFSTGTPPIVTLQPVDPVFACAFSASLTIAGTEGFTGPTPADTQDLAYQWFYNVPGTSTWTEILPANTDYSGQQTATLNIIDTASLNGYQYYCQLREDTVTCYEASNAVKLDVRVSIWDGTNWSVPPTIDRFALINGDYDTSILTNDETSFEACECEVTTGNVLTIANNTYVLVENDLTVDGSIIVDTDGSFVQINDTAIVDGAVLTSKDKISVDKETAYLATFLEYTYWSSPVVGEIISDGLSDANANRIYAFNGQNYLDATRETNNDNGTVAGQDDIDDDANDWQFVSGGTIMAPGIGYAATHVDIGFTPNQYRYTFEGPFNNGIYNIPIYRNDSETNDNNWNFIGNPYPSAIDADLFLAANASIDQNAGTAAINGAIFFWSHNTVADGTANGNENFNFSQSDYAIINGSGNVAGGDMVLPTRHIPSGQGFFVSMDDGAASSVVSGNVRTTNVVFNNSMRVTGNNNQFFRSATDTEPNKIWLNLTSDNGIFNQTLVAYVDGATNNDDGTYYDAQKNLSAETNSVLYSIITDSESKKFAIQGKDPNSLTLGEIIPIGFYTAIDQPTIYSFSIAQLEGEFMNGNTIYLRDKLLNVDHNLSNNPYAFTSETGEYNSRFEIVFTPMTLSIKDNQISANDVTIVELTNGNVEFKLNSSQNTITNVEILDMLGRRVYNLKGNSASEVYNLSQLSKSAYIAKITLSNGQVISKKAIKQQ
ncbi:lamin tail domain-containing protein [Winogradskyella eximia]|uniref:lamin tail domain-containing protein n=1 Tax=Winogradskyella eximia TaxID=262006 RepID=UPI002490400C|nr:lamin tail domain-containing protein [Winogradskyella eximia]